MAKGLFAVAEWVNGWGRDRWTVAQWRSLVVEAGALCAYCAAAGEGWLARHNTTERWASSATATIEIMG